MTNLLLRYQPLLLQITRFGIVGLTAAGINFCVVVFLVQQFALEPLIAYIFGFVISFQMSYWGHRLWTFSDTAAMHSHSAALPKLVLVQIGNFLGSELLYSFFLSHHIPYQIGLILVLGIMPIFTYFTSKMWVFK